MTPVEINPKDAPANCSIIWLHGLGADGYDFVDIVPQLRLQEKLAARFIFPHAPMRKVTWANGQVMRGWFDVTSLEGDNFIDDEKGVRSSAKLIDELIDAEIARGIPSDRIVLAGFSQGGAMALHCGLRYTQKLAGILMLSGFLVLQDKLSEITSANRKSPILMLHGNVDPVVKISWAEKACKMLNHEKLNVEFKTYHMEHTVCYEEVCDISNWLQKTIE